MLLLGVDRKSSIPAYRQISDGAMGRWGRAPGRHGNPCPG
jgi:hypothetical protein